MPDELSDQEKKLQDAEINLETMQSAIDKLDALGHDTRDMKRTYTFLENQVKILKTIA
jgi:hypothetical protein|tara:strand:- start:4702 stop:4875 length:174 start_codon:yes stop_codon:yes gene_type:complete